MRARRRMKLLRKSRRTRSGGGSNAVSPTAAGAGGGAGSGGASLPVLAHVTLLAPERVAIGAAVSLDVQFASTASEHSETDWIGIYPVDEPSKPGRSNGRWRY